VFIKFTVAIPTYKRPGYLARAIDSVLKQTLPPLELLIISRIDDYPTAEVIEEYISKLSSKSLHFRSVNVSQPGFLPPVIAAIENATGDVLVLLDDDAEAHLDWLERISQYYSDPNVGGVGGRCINYFNGIMQTYPLADKVGKLFWYGRSIGNMYRECSFSGYKAVDFLMGGNCSYRLSLLKNCVPDQVLQNNVAFHWEMDVGLQIKAAKYKILFDPNIVVDHHSAPREVDGLRTVNFDGVYWSNFNYCYLMRKHLTIFGYFCYLIYSFLIGWSGSPGILYCFFFFLSLRKLDLRLMVLASILGRLNGVLYKKNISSNLYY